MSMQPFISKVVNGKAVGLTNTEISMKEEPTKQEKKRFQELLKKAVEGSMPQDTNLEKIVNDIEVIITPLEDANSDGRDLIIFKEKLYRLLEKFLTQVREEAYDQGAAEATMICNEKIIPQAVEEERKRIVGVLEGIRQEISDELYEGNYCRDVLSDVITKIQGK